MAEKTIRGNKCPKCFSFVKNGLLTCPVCGYKLNSAVINNRETQVEKEKRVIPTIPAGQFQNQLNTIVCSKCGTENAPDFKFCKICKHPLQDQENSKPAETIKPTNLSIDIEWLKHPDKKKAEPSLFLSQTIPGFRAASRWKEYGFFIFQIGDQYHILVKRIASRSNLALFKQCSGIFILESGSEFYLGAVKFQLLGDFREDTDNKTVMKSNQTVLKGPGEKSRPLFFEGKPRLKIDRITSKREFVEISDAFNVGRPQVAELFGANEDDLRQSGVSQEHIVITPYQGGHWLLNPLPGKPVFLEIKEYPVVVNQGETLRWVSNGHLEEFKLFIHSGVD